MPRHSVGVLVNLPAKVVWSEASKRTDWPRVRHVRTVTPGHPDPPGRSDPPDHPLEEGSTAHYELNHPPPNKLVIYVQTVDHLTMTRVDVIVEAPGGAGGSSILRVIPEDDDSCRVELTSDIEFTGNWLRRRIAAGLVAHFVATGMAGELESFRRELEARHTGIPPAP